MTKEVMSVAVVCGLTVSFACGQYDPGAWWTDYKGGPERTGSRVVPEGPATVVEWTQESLQPNSMGGFSIDGNDDAYFMTRSGQQFVIDPGTPGSGLVNPSLEDGVIGPWGPNGGVADHASYPKPGYSSGTLGTYFGYMSVFNNETVGQISDSVFEAGTAYTFSAWVMGGGNDVGEVVFEIGYSDNGNFVLLNSAQYTVNGTWAQQPGVSWTPQGGNPEVGQPIFVRLGSGNNSLPPEDIWFDLFNISPLVNDPGTPPTVVGFNQVFKLNGGTGEVMAQSPELLGSTRDYGGVAIGADAIWCTTSSPVDENGDPNATSTVWKLDKDDLSIIGAFRNQAVFDDAFSQGLRGQPVLGNQGNVYVYERGDGVNSGGEIHAINATTGAISWSYEPFLFLQTFFGTLGPVYEDSQGRSLITYFSRDTLLTGVQVRDNGNGTYTEMWFGGPDSFNWFGSGALAQDESAIFVTTFNDGDVPSLWAIDPDFGNVLDSVPGDRGLISERNHFGRPSLIASSTDNTTAVYCGGSFGKIHKYTWNPATGSLTETWVYHPVALDVDMDNQFDAGPLTPDAWATLEDFVLTGEFTVVSAVEANDPLRPGTYVYGGMQSQKDPNTPSGQNGADSQIGQYVILRDNGPNYDLIYRTDFDGTLPSTRYGSQSPTPLSDGSFIFAGGNASITGSANGKIYKIGANSLDWTIDGSASFFDALDFLGLYDAGNTSVDVDGIPGLDPGDIELFLLEAVADGN
ncbi:MAG: carbohydrate binding domain-containing protein [Phycisphaeraceae bacterium]|nr:MAG: carbohydrate binding domain-containing protein [Phycisphaeraceae bacterium]